MQRVTKCFVLLALLSPTCWAQTPSSPVGTAPGFKRVGIASVRNRSARVILPTLTSAHTPLSPGNATGFKRLGGMAVRTASVAATPKYNGITYNGGPIIDDANGVNAYYIWYGDWSKDKAAQTILTDFITHIGGSPYFNTNTTYYDYEVGPNGTDVVKDRVINGVHYMGSANDFYSQGAALTDYQVYLAVANAITGGALPADANGVYFLLTSADVTETSGFCTNYCAWHDSSAFEHWPPVNGVDVKFAFEGNAAAQCPANCIQEDVLPTPNNNVGADGLANLIAHELEETVTDPDGTGWINADTSENGDMCAWTFGETYSLPNGSFANMKLGKRQYLIQQNWVNAKGGYCAKSWDE